LILLYTALEFLCGSLMFSYWLGRAVKQDLRNTGDGNPGAYNLFHAAGIKLGLAGVALDFGKGFFPLFFLVSGEYVRGLELVPVAAAPIFGHAFSPFLKGRGGKGIAVTFGVWSAVTSFEVSLVYAIILALFSLAASVIKKGRPVSSDADGFMVVAGMLLLAAYLVYRAFPLPILALWLANFLLLACTNRHKLYRLGKAALEKHRQNDSGA